MPPESVDTVRHLLDHAVERGIVSAAQRDALGALRLELSGDAPVSPVEARGGFNSVTVAYVIGAMLVVFASVWFLADRWEALGPVGVLAVAAAYSALLLVARFWLERRAFHQAAAIALMLVVALTPVTVWCLENVTGFWPAGVVGNYLDAASQHLAIRWAVVDGVTLLAALLAMRWRPSVALTIPITLLTWVLWFHLSHAIFGASMVGALDRWLIFADGLLVCAVAGEIDRWQEKRRAAGTPVNADYAFFFWLGGLQAFFLGYIPLWSKAEAWRHLLLGIALVLIAASLYARRRTHLAFGLLALFGYLAYLALDVFREFVSLPLVLGTLGILLIMATVWMQRRFPRLVERVNAERRGAVIPPIVTWGPLIYALVMAVLSRGP